MKEVKLRMNEQEKYEVIKELVDHNVNKNRASKKLGIPEFATYFFNSYFTKTYFLSLFLLHFISKCFIIDVGR